MIRTAYPEDHGKPSYWVPVKARGGGSYTYEGPYIDIVSAEYAAIPFGWYIHLYGCEVRDSRVIYCPGAGACKQWRVWFEDCPNCGSISEVLTADPRDGFVNGGDLVRCRECYCLGHIVCDNGDYTSVAWQDDMCAKCYRRESDAIEFMRRVDEGGGVFARQQLTQKIEPWQA